MLRRFTRFGAGDGRFDSGFARVDWCLFCSWLWLLRRFPCFGAGDGRFDSRFTRIDRRLFCGRLRLLRRFTRFSAGYRGFNGGFARVCGLLLNDHLLLSRFPCFGAGDGRFNGRFTRIDTGFFRLPCLRFFRLTRARRGLTRFTCGNGFAVIWLLTGGDHHRLRCGRFFLAHASQRRVNGILIFLAWLNGSLLMTLLTGQFFTLQTSLAGFKAGFRFGSAFFFHRDGINLGLLLTEVLHQRNVAWTDPGARAAFDAVSQIMRLRFIVQLTFAVPVQLLWKQIGRAGIGAGAAADTAFLFLLFTHFGGGGGEQAVSDFYDRNVQPRQGKAHQWAAHDHHLIAAGTESGLLQKMTNRRAQTRPDVPRTRH